MLWLLKQELHTSLLRCWIWNQEVWFTNQHAMWPSPALFSVESKLCPLNRIAGILCVLEEGGREHQGDNRLAKMWCSLENCKNLNVHDSSSSLAFIRFVLSQSHAGCVGEAEIGMILHIPKSTIAVIQCFSVGLEKKKKKMFRAL